MCFMVCIVLLKLKLASQSNTNTARSLSHFKYQEREREKKAQHFPKKTRKSTLHDSTSSRIDCICALKFRCWKAGWLSKAQASLHPCSTLCCACCCAQNIVICCDTFRVHSSSHVSTSALSPPPRAGPR